MIREKTIQVASHVRRCAIPNCGKRSMGRGFCSAHYARLRKHGHPLAGPTRQGEPLDFFNSVVMEHRGDGCLIWPYAKHNNGYGMMTLGGKMRYVHRVACESVHGPAPTPDHVAAHSCGNGKAGCVNPRHLSWKTHRENSQEMVAHGTSARGNRNGSAKLTEAEVQLIRAMRGKESQRAIAKQMGVSPSLVGLVQNGKCWGWLE